MARAKPNRKNYRSIGEMIGDIAELARPAERLTVSQAAEKYRYLNTPGAYVGPWKNETVPYMVEVMDTLISREFTACVFVGPAQCGKTDCILNWLTYSIICDPADMILYQTSQATARDFSKRRVDRLHRYTRAAGERLRKSGDSDNTYDKFYVNGMMFTLSWPTINELSGRPVGRVALTDYDRMPQNIDGEGSPFDLARKRTTTFKSFGMTFVESSPGYSVTDPGWQPQTPHEAPPAPGIFSLYNRGDRRRWYWTCPHCGDAFEPAFHLLHYPDCADDIEAGEAAMLMCPRCHALIEPGMKYELNLAGRWLGEGQRLVDGRVLGQRIRSDIASFWLRGPAAAFADWKTLVINYRKAEKEFERTGSQEALKATVNTDQGEPYYTRGTGSVRSAEDLKNRAESFAEDGPVVPEGVRFLTATIDVQANRFEVQVHGVCAPPFEGAQVDHVVIDRFAIVKSKRTDEDGERLWVKPNTHLEDWDLLKEQVLDKVYPLADGSGRTMAIKWVACDSGGKKGVTGKAYDFWRKMRAEGNGKRFQLVKGTGEPKAPIVNLTYPDSSRKDRTAAARGEIPVLLIQTDKVKDILDAALERQEPGGMIRFSDVLPDEFYSELVVEQKNAKGQWENPRKMRQEAWDLLVYHLALCELNKIAYLRWDNPPGWAREWDDNDLVSEPEKPRRFEGKRKRDYSLRKLAETLG